MRNSLSTEIIIYLIVTLVFSVAQVCLAICASLFQANVNMSMLSLAIGCIEIGMTIRILVLYRRWNHTFEKD